MTSSEEILRQPNMDCAAWLLVTTHKNVYNDKEKDQEKYKVHSLRRKGSIMEPSPVLKEIKEIKFKVKLGA